MQQFEAVRFGAAEFLDGVADQAPDARAVAIAVGQTGSGQVRGHKDRVGPVQGHELLGRAPDLDFFHDTANFLLPW